MFDPSLATLAQCMDEERRPLVLSGDMAVSASAWRQRVQDWFVFLRDRDARHIALFHQDVVEFSAAMFGAWHAGATVWLAADMRADTVARLSKHVQDWIGEFPQAIAPECRIPGPVELPDIHREHAALMVFTSGSSGEPLAISKTLAQLENELSAHESVWGRTVSLGALVAGTVPHQHLYGLLFRVLWPLLSGRTLYNARVEYPETLLALSARHSLALISSPAFLKRLPDHLHWHTAQPYAAVLCSGGVLLPAAAAQTRRLLGRVPLEIYGSSETGGIAWRTQRLDVAEGGTPWTALPGVKVELESGLLVVDSPFLPSKQTPWLTSDLAELNADGSFTLGQRADQIVKLEEKRISLSAIERALLGFPEIDNARVLLLDGTRAQLGAVLVLSAIGRQRLLDGKHALNQYFRQQLSPFCEAIALPRRWRYIEAMPSNGLGKTVLADLQQLFGKTLERWYPEVLAVASSENRVELTLNVGRDLVVFDGHFPEIAILPGVAQLEWAMHFGRHYLSLPPVFLRMDVIKFQRIITPGQPVRLDLQWLPLKNVMEFSLHTHKGQHASGRMVFQERHD